jgi:putative restriction endonuclease
VSSPASERWLETFGHLRVDGGSVDPAPHKPLLLLTLLELADQGPLPSRIELTPQLAFRFCNYWDIVGHRRSQRPDIRLPFYHLQNDGVWTALGENLQPLPDRGARLLARYVAPEAEFLQLTGDPSWRQRARQVLIETYFQPQEQVELYELFDMQVPSDEDRARAARYQAPERPPVNVREVRFRLDVVSAYKYTCALTGYRLLTIDAASIVDAAHIHQFAQAGSNDVRNGLALSKNAHWLFDNGLWTVDDNYLIRVAVKHFTEESPDQRALEAYRGQPIGRPADQRLWPDREHLRWHRENKYLGD